MDFTLALVKEGSTREGPGCGGWVNFSRAKIKIKSTAAARSQYQVLFEFMGETGQELAMR